MNLDITGKVGIENALELLEEELSGCEKLRKDDQAFVLRTTRIELDGRIGGLRRAIEIVKLNLPIKTK